MSGQSKKTTLVLGAGSSFDYGMPLGSGLLNEIQASEGHVVLKPLARQARVSGNSLDDRFLKANRAQWEEFRVALRKSGQPSIDSFLGNRLEFKDFGVYSIADALLPREQKLVQLSSGFAGWYPWLFQRLFGDSPACKREVRIVTFNYERSLELCLSQMLMHSFGLGFSDAWKHLEPLDIVHVYGTLTSDLPFELLSRLSESNAGRDASEDDKIRASRGIKIIPDSRSEHDPDLAKARQHVMWANEVVFLGFAYDKTNLTRIGVDPKNKSWLERASQRQVLGTSLGLGERETQSARNWMGIDETIVPVDCLKLLREYSSLAD